VAWSTKQVVLKFRVFGGRSDFRMNNASLRYAQKRMFAWHFAKNPPVFLQHHCYLSSNVWCTISARHPAVQSNVLAVANQLLENGLLSIFKDCNIIP